MADPRSVTIHDVAKRAGVAVSSVSRALGNHPDVSEAMHARVAKAAKELGYVPDPAAQSLRSGSSRLIGLIVRDFANPFFGEIISGIEDVVTAAGYTLLVTDSGRDADQELERLNALRQRRVDALLLSTVDDTAATTHSLVKGFKRPVLLLDRESDDPALGRVLYDHATGVREATRDLIQLGHRRIAFITGSIEIRPTRERLRGFVEAYEEAGLPVADAEQITGVFSASFARATTADLLARPADKRPTAIIAGGVQATIGVLESLSELGLSPGDDVSMVVCDDLPWLRVMRPRISAVLRDPDAMGRASAELLLAMISGQPADTVTLPTRYETRDTTRPVSGQPVGASLA